MNLDDGNVYDRKLRKENISFYNDYGYLIVPDLISEEDINALKKETIEIFRGNRGKIDGLLDLQNETDEEILKKYVAIHFPHKISPLIKNFLSHKNVTEVLSSIVSPNIKCMQSMLFVKAPGKAGQAWHQDEYYIP